MGSWDGSELYNYTQSSIHTFVHSFIMIYVALCATLSCGFLGLAGVSQHTAGTGGNDLNTWHISLISAQSKQTFIKHTLGARCALVLMIYGGKIYMK